MANLLRFKQHLLTEKISKAENKAGLSDPNITFGMEFEYIDHRIRDADPEFNSDLSEMHDKLVREMESTRDSVSDDRDEWITELRDEYKQEYEGEFQTELDDATSDLDELEKQIAELKDELATAESELEELENDDADDLENDSEISSKEAEISSINDQIEEKGDEYDETLDKKEEAEASLEKVGEIDDSELEEWADEQNMYYDYLDRNPYDWPSIPDELMDWWVDMGGEDPDNITQSLYEYILYDDESSWNNLPYPEPGYYGNDDRPFEENAEEFFDFDALPSFVASNYVVSDYHGNANETKKWRIEDDSSLSDGGVEIVSPILPIADAKNVVKEMFDYISDAGETDSSCGLHVHLGHTKANLADDLDILKVMLFLDEGWITKEFSDREHSTYCQSMMSRLDDNAKGEKKFRGDGNGNYHEVEDPAYMSPADMIKFRKRRLLPLFKAFKANFLPSSQKYNAVNWQTIDEGHIEIRWLGGQDYENKYGEVMNALGKFAAVLKLGLDPNYKKNVYMKKLWKIAEKHAGPSVDKLQSKVELKLAKTILKDPKVIALGLDNNTRESVGFYDYKGVAYKVVGEPKSGKERAFKLMKTKDFIKKIKGNKVKGVDIRMTNDEYIK